MKTYLRNLMFASMGVAMLAFAVKAQDQTDAELVGSD